MEHISPYQEYEKSSFGEWSLNLGGDLRSHSGVHMYHEDLKAIDVQHTNCEFLEVLLHSPIYCLHGA